MWKHEHFGVSAVRDYTALLHSDVPTAVIRLNKARGWIFQAEIQYLQ